MSSVCPLKRLYSNYWCCITPEDNNRPTKHHILVLLMQYNNTHTLRKASQELAFYPPHPPFGHPAAGVKMFVSNEDLYGYLPVALQHDQTLEEGFTHTPIGYTMEPSQYVYIAPKEPKWDLMRYHQSLNSFHAVDGKALNSSQLQAMGINKLPGYKDPYSGRLLTREKIGCFLSHYNIWKEEHTCNILMTQSHLPSGTTRPWKHTGTGTGPNTCTSRKQRKLGFDLWFLILHMVMCPPLSVGGNKDGL
uniref:Glycosyl transferase family 25 domain-containing protein n=1 Tax=Anabas testudineus TaxID=64144 RepID=A0A3Q1K8E2_ANATE